jgi:hypothetical protein
MSSGKDLFFSWQYTDQTSGEQHTICTDIHHMAREKRRQPSSLLQLHLAKDHTSRISNKQDNKVLSRRNLFHG